LTATLAEEDLCPLPILRKSAKVKVAFVKNTAICIQYVSLEGKLDELLDKMWDAYERMLQDPLPPSVDSLCAAKSVSDDTWYRGRIAGIAQEGLTVHYVDYGNTELLPKGNLRELLPEFKSHAFARELQLPITSAHDLSEVVTQLTADAAFDADFATKDGQWQVDLKQPDGSKLSQTLIDMGKATRGEDSFFAEELTAHHAHPARLESAPEIDPPIATEAANSEYSPFEVQCSAEAVEDVAREEGRVCLAVCEAASTRDRAEIGGDARAYSIDDGNIGTQVEDLPEEEKQLERLAIESCLSGPDGRQETASDAERAPEGLSEACSGSTLEGDGPKIEEIPVGDPNLKEGPVEDAPIDFARLVAVHISPCLLEHVWGSRCASLRGLV